jgi:MFS family permease
MAVLMPIAGRVYDRIGARWPAAIGLTIVAAGNYLMHTITVDTSREHIMWLLVLQGAGLGIAMMPIFAGGMAILPVARINVASAFNNVAQRVSGALGLAVLTAIFTTQQAQQMAGRATLLPTNIATPDLGPAVPTWMSQYATYQVTELQVFVGAMDDLFLIAAALSALSALGALLLRSGPAPAAPGNAAPQQETASAASGNGRSTRPAQKLADVRADTSQRES